MLNNLIKETNKSIRLEFFADSIFRQFKDYMSYVKVRVLTIALSRIIVLFHLQPPHSCSVQNRRSEHLFDRMSEIMLEELCNHVAKWVANDKQL